MRRKHRRCGSARLLALGLMVGLGLSAFGLALPGRAAPASAQSATVTFNYLVGSGLLCSLGPGACPDVASASNGDTITLSGAGTLSLHPDALAGGGTFTHRNAQGQVLATGMWTAEQLLSFVSYGTSPGFPATFVGGDALVLIHLQVGGVTVHDGVLRITCVVGSPPAGAHEGIRLNVQDVLNFNTQVSGATLFIRVTP